MRGVMTLDLIAVHNVDIRRELFPQTREFRDIVLGVPIGVKNEFFARGTESAPQSSAVPAVFVVQYELELRQSILQRAQKLAAPVGRTVVDDDDLKIVRQFFDRAFRVQYESRDGTLVVVTREEN